MVPTISQAQQDLLQKARRSLYRGNHRTALPYYEKLDSMAEGENPQYRYNLALCYLNVNYKPSYGIKYLQQLEKYKEDIGPEYYFNLALGYRYNYQFDKAIENYNRYMEKAEKLDEERKKEVRRSIETCKNAKEFIRDPLEVEVTNLGTTLNTSFHEYNPLLSSDGQYMLFTSKRKGSTGGLQSTEIGVDTVYGQYFEDVYISVEAGGEWHSPINVGDPINTDLHDAAAGLDPSGKLLYIYRTDTMGWGNIMLSKAKKMFSPEEEETIDWQDMASYSNWSTPKELPPPINTEYWEQSVTVTTQGKTVYFASDRPGSMGEADIYVTHKTDTGWSDAKRLGPNVNTPYRERTAFIHPDRKTLYFASAGHNSMGGLDIFITRKTDTGWTEPENMGFPINTPDDEASFNVVGDGETAFFSSARKGNHGGQDLYKVGMPEQHQPQPLMVTRGKIISLDGSTPDDLKANLDLLQLNTEVDEQTHMTMDLESGKFVLFMPKGYDYRFEVEAANHHGYTDTLSADTGRDVPYQKIKLVPTDTVKTKVAQSTSPDTTAQKEPDEVTAQQPQEGTESTTVTETTAPGGEKRQLFLVSYYGFNKAILTSAARQKLTQLVEVLKNNPEVDLEIAGYTDNIGSEEYNLKLGKKRANAVYQYLKKKGVSATRIESVWYGEKDPFAPNYLPHGVDNPDGRQLNRRTELYLVGDSSEMKSISQTGLSAPELYESKQLISRDYDLGDLYFSVQVAAFQDELPAEYSEVFETILKKPTRENNLRRFLVGKFPSYEKASQCKELIRKMGIDGAFVVPYLDGSRVPIEKALSYKEGDSQTAKTP